MPIPAIAAVAAGSALASGIGSYFGGKAQERGAKEAAKIQARAQARIQKMLEEIGIPSVEAQQIALESPELVGELIAEQQEDTELKQIQEDPRLREAQMDALRNLQTLGEVGLTPEERAQRSEMLRQGAAQEQARQQQILQGMAQRGSLDSGASLLAQLQSSAAAGADSRRQAEQMAADVAGRRRQALAQAGSMAGGLSAEDFRRQAMTASAQDQIARFNAMQRADVNRMNLQARQAIENEKAALANQQQMYNKQLLQQRYQNEMDKARTLAGVQSQGATQQANYQLQQGAAQAGMYTGIGSALGTAGMGVAGYMGDVDAALAKRNKPTKYGFGG